MAYEDVTCLCTLPKSHQYFKPIAYVNDRYLGSRNEFELAELEAEARQLTRQHVQSIPIQDRVDIYIYAIYRISPIGDISCAAFYSAYAVSIDKYRLLKSNSEFKINCLCYKYSKYGIDLAR